MLTAVQNANLMLPENLDVIIDKGISFTLKKHDVSTTVGVIRGADFGLPRDLLLKRFNYRGFFDFLIHAIFNGRAKRLWNKNILLYRKGLPVPEPLTYIESSLKNKNAFFISSFIDNAESLSGLYRKGVVPNNKELVSRLAETIALWHISGAVHGDLKWPNILVQKNPGTYVCFLIDLDQARMFSSPYIKGIEKDLERFYRFGLQLGAEQWVEAEFFPEYISFIPDKIMQRINLDSVKNNATKEWIRKGRKRL
jgi:Lipopolysaccharide kinase (Kdo/WaaP) family